MSERIKHMHIKLLLAAIAAFFMSTSYGQYESVEVPEPLSRVYVSPDGSGDQSGVDISNTLPVTAMWNEIDSAAPGTAFTLLTGEYNIPGTHLLTPQGTPDAPIYIEAYQNDEVTFVGSYQLTDKASGDLMFYLKTGNLVMRNFNIRNAAYPISNRRGSVVENVVLENLNMDDVSICVNMGNAADLEVAAINWTISNLYCTDYYRHAVALGSGNNTLSNNITIRNVYGNPCVDRSQEDDTGANRFVVGIRVGHGAHDVLIEDVALDGHRDYCGPFYDENTYVNGDGIAIEDFGDIKATDITIRNAQVYNSADSGLDVKVDGVTVENFIAVNIRKGFRIMYTQDFECHNCSSYNIRHTGNIPQEGAHIQPLNGGIPTFYGGTFHCQNGEQVIWSSNDLNIVPDNPPVGAVINSSSIVDIDNCSPTPFTGTANDLSGFFDEPDAPVELPPEQPIPTVYRVTSNL